MAVPRSSGESSAWRRMWPVGATAACAVAVTLMTPSIPVPGRPFSASWWMVALAFAIAELIVLHIPLRADDRVVTVVEIPLVVSLALASPTGLIAGRMLGSAAAFATKPGRGSAIPLLALGGAYAETVAALAVYGVALGDAVPIELRGWAAALGAVLTAFCVRRALVVLSAPGPQRRALVLDSAARVPATITTGLIGILTLIALWTEPWSVTMVAGLTGFGYVALRVYGELSRRHADLEALIRFTAAVRDGDLPGAGAGRILEGVADHLRTSAAALFVLDGDGAHAVVHASGTTTDADVDPVEVRALIAATPSDGDHAASLGADDLTMLSRLVGRDLEEGLAVPLTVAGTPTGVIVAAGRRGVDTFDRHDKRFFAALGGMTGATLDRSRLVDRLRREVSEREHQAMHDALTGLPNRRQFLSAAAGMLESGAPGVVTVLTLDLDRFKDVNDTLGHEEGDRLVADVAERVRTAVRPTDTVARLGGDEFAVLLRVGSPADAVGVARRIEESLRRPFRRAGLDIEITASTGIAFATGRSDTAATLLQHADIAMFAAKSSGASHEVYAPELDHYSPRRLVLAGELRAGIAACDIRVHYQPKIRVADGAVVGAEALARWISPAHGEVSPAEFIPIAEKTGLIRPLTYAVLREALGAAARWHSAGAPIGVAVNISPRNLLDPDFVQTVGEIVSESRIDPSVVTFEITEGSVLHDSGRASGVLSRISELGIDISIDDFGTGYSSLGYLQRLPVSEVKIDRMFVMRMDVDGADRAIVDSTIQLAHRLGLQVVAEGVESAAALEMLAAAGCDLAQGYHIARPMPDGAFRTWLAERIDRGSTVTRIDAAGPRSRPAAS